MDFDDFCQELLHSSEGERISRGQLVAFSIMEGLEKMGLGMNAMQQVILALFRSTLCAEGDVNEPAVKLFNQVLMQHVDTDRLASICVGGDSPTFVANVVKMVKGMNEQAKEASIAMVCAIICVDGEISEAEKAFLNLFLD